MTIHAILSSVRQNRRNLVFGAILASTSPHHSGKAAAAQTSRGVSGWVPGPALPMPRSEFSATVLEGQIFVAGGFGMETDVSSLNPTTGEWTRHAELPSPRHHLGLAALNGHVYVAGGHAGDTNSATETFWRLDPALDRWEDVAPLPQGPRGALGCAALDGKLYVAGGSSRDLAGPATADVASFDPVDGVWTTLPPLPTAREHLSLAAVAGKIIAIGGREGGDADPTLGAATDLYDPVSGEWQRRAPLPVPRSGMGIASDGSSVIVLGGEGADGIHTAVNRYDVETDTWSDLADLPIGRHGAAAVIFDRTLYAIGGSTLAWNVRNISGVDMLAI